MIPFHHSLKKRPSQNNQDGQQDGSSNAACADNTLFSEFLGGFDSPGFIERIGGIFHRLGRWYHVPGKGGLELAAKDKQAEDNTDPSLVIFQNHGGLLQA
jgi:hypothetical protein